MNVKQITRNNGEFRIVVKQAPLQVISANLSRSSHWLPGKNIDSDKCDTAVLEGSSFMISLAS